MKCWAWRTGPRKDRLEGTWADTPSETRSKVRVVVEERGVHGAAGGLMVLVLQKEAWSSAENEVEEGQALPRERHRGGRGLEWSLKGRTRTGTR